MCLFCSRLRRFWCVYRTMTCFRQHLPCCLTLLPLQCRQKKKPSACVTVCINTNPLLLRATVTAPALWTCRCRQKIGIGMPYLFSTHKKGGTLKSFKLTSVSLISSTQTRQKWTVNAAFRNNKWQDFCVILWKARGRARELGIIPIDEREREDGAVWRVRKRKTRNDNCTVTGVGQTRF